MSVNEDGDYMKKRKVISISVILSLIVIILIMLNFQKTFHREYNSNLEIKTIEANNVINENKIFCFQIADTYTDDEQLTDLLDQNNSINSLKKFNKDINNNFNFLEITMQPLEVIGQFYHGGNDFVVTPRSKKDLKNQKVNLKGKKVYVTPLKAIQIGKYAFNTYFNKVEDGHGFNNSDFIYESNNDIPVILGNEYKNYYNLGDIIEVNYLEQNVKLIIIGFFEKDLSISINGNLYNLDTYICSPHFDIEDIKDGKDKLFQQRYYLQKNNGYIQLDSDISKKLTDESYFDEVNLESYVSLIKEISKNNNISYEPLKLISEIEIKNK